MSRKISLLFATVILLFCFSACKKEGHSRNDSPSITTIVNATVKSGEIYRLNLSQYGNGTASIVKQATSYSLSEITYEPTNGGYMYKYATTGGAKSGKSASDQVILQMTGHGTGGSGGCRGGSDGSSMSSDKKIVINMTLE